MMTSASSDIFNACRIGDLATVEMMYENDASIIDAEDHKGFTPLILAVYNDQPAVVDFLLEKGAKTESPDMTGNSALMGVCFKGYKEIAAKLLHAGADVNQRNGNGATVLTFASTFGHLEIAEMLLKKYADINLRDSRGKSPLDHTRIQENDAIVPLIERYTAPNV